MTDPAYVEKLFSQYLKEQSPAERYRQICSDCEEEIYWEELPVKNGRLDDIPFCPVHGIVQEWLVLDSWKDEILYSAVLTAPIEEVGDED